MAGHRRRAHGLLCFMAGGQTMRIGVAVGLVATALLGTLVSLEAGPDAQPKGAPPAADVVVDDWGAGPLGQQGIPPGWEGQTWGKTSAFALRIVVDEGRRVLRLESQR